MEINYEQCSLRSLKMMRKYHRAYRKDPKHHVMFHFLNKKVKDRQTQVMQETKLSMFKRMMAIMAARRKKKND